MTAKLDWAGLSSLQVPLKVLEGCTRPEIDVFRHEIKDLPAPLNTADLWLCCRSSWPHTDPDFEGSVFITLAIQADHVYCQAIPGDQRVELGVFSGCLFVTDPMSLHWLAPSNDETNQGFIGLQWEVPHHQLRERWDALCAQLGQLGPVKPIWTQKIDNILPPNGEYVGAPPTAVY